MGIRLFGSSSSCDCKPDKTRRPLPNPDPSNYTVVKYQQVGPNLVVLIHYHDCTNFEGRKIMVYENIGIGNLMGQGRIDPHFSDNGMVCSPFVRVEPTARGWEAALAIAALIEQVH